MTDNAQLQMQLEKVKDDIGQLEFSNVQLNEQMKEFRSIVDDIRVQLATLRGKL